MASKIHLAVDGWGLPMRFPPGAGSGKGPAATTTEGPPGMTMPYYRDERRAADVLSVTRAIAETAAATGRCRGS